MGQLTDIFNKAKERDKMVQFANKYKIYIATITMIVKNEFNEDVNIETIHPIMAKNREQAQDILNTLANQNNLSNNDYISWILDYSLGNDLSETVLSNITKCDFRLESDLGEEGVAYVIN